MAVTEDKDRTFIREHRSAIAALTGKRDEIPRWIKLTKSILINVIATGILYTIAALVLRLRGQFTFQDSFLASMGSFTAVSIATGIWDVIQLKKQQRQSIIESSAPLGTEARPHNGCTSS
jgi:hypothetical protein